MINWDAIGAVGELVGAAAVLATLFYLAKQIKHSHESRERANELAQASSIAESNTLFQSVWEQLAHDGELAGIYQRAMSGEDLNPVESVRFVGFLNLYFSWMEVLYSQTVVDLGFSDVESSKQFFDIGMPFISKLLNTTVGEAWWNGDAKSYYSPGFYNDLSKIHNNS